MKRTIPVKWDNNVPIACVQMAERRTGPMIEFYGCHIRDLSLEMLAASCYLQGIEDAWKAFGEPMVLAAPVTDYAI